MEIQAASRSEKAALGQGYDVEKEEFVGRCARGQTAFAGNQEAHLNFERSLSEDQAHKELGFEVGAKVRYGLFSGSAAAQYASSSSSSEFSDVTTYSHVINFKNAKLDFPGLPGGLTPEGLAAKGAGAGNLVGDNWPVTCGQEFVSQITLGAKLFVSVRVEFAAREDKESFGAQFSFSGPPVEVKANLSQASRTYGKRASLTLHAFQLGGDVRRLPAVFGAGPGTAPILTASLGNPDAVLGALDAAVRYAKDDFTRQIDPNIPLDSPIGPAQLSYITSPWAELGLFAPPPLISAGVAAARRLLSEEFEQNARYQRRLSRILNGPIRLSARQLARFTKMQRDVARNLALIQDAATVCYSDFVQAPLKVAETLEQLQDFVADEFDVQPESFAQWWDMKDLPGTLQRDRQTLLDIAAPFIPQFVDFQAIEDPGLALQQELSRVDGPFPTQVSVAMFTSRAFSVMGDSKVRELDLVDLDRDVPFESLAPLRWTPHLRSLTLDAMRPMILDLAPVQALSALTELKISGASVTSLAPLAPLTQLVSIALEGPVSDLSPLGASVALRELKVDDAEVTDVSALADLSQLRELLLAGSPVASAAPLLGLPHLATVELGRPGVPVVDMESLVAALGASTFFLTDETFTMSERGDAGISDPLVDADVVWTRRGTTNVFDTVTRLSTGGELIHGVGAFTGVQIRDGQSVPVVFMMQRRGDAMLRYLGILSDDRRSVDDGFVSKNGFFAGGWAATRS